MKENETITEMSENLTYVKLLELRQKLTEERKKISDNEDVINDNIWGRAHDLNFYLNRIEKRINYLEDRGHYINEAPSDSEEIEQLKTANANLQKELKVTEELLEERQKVLDAIPECKSHGSCVPHALEWIEEMKAKYC